MRVAIDHEAPTRSHPGPNFHVDCPLEIRSEAMNSVTRPAGSLRSHFPAASAPKQSDRSHASHGEPESPCEAKLLQLTMVGCLPRWTSVSSCCRPNMIA